MEEKKQISIIPNIKNGIYRDGDFEVKTNLDLRATVDLIQLALTKSKEPENIEQSTEPPMVGKKLEICIFCANHSDDIEVVSDFKLEPTLYLLRQAYTNKAFLLFQNTNYKFFYKNNS